MRGWIEIWEDARESFPPTGRLVLLSFRNCTVPMIGRCEETEDGGLVFFVEDTEETFLQHNLFVNGWQPLPRCLDDEEESCEEETLMKRCRRLRQIADILRDDGLNVEAQDIDIATIDIKELLAKSQVREETIRELLKERANG